MILPVGIASNSGALDIPRSDDWSYLVTLFRWVDDGRLGFNDWVSMTLVGQLVLTMPVVKLFGNSIAAVHVFSALIGFVGLLILVKIGREVLTLGRGAVLLAATIALGPLWGPLAPTYMTDVPALTAQLASMACAVAAFRGRSVSIPRYSAALAFGFLGVSIRQYEVIPLIAIVMVATWLTVAERDRKRVKAVLALGALAGIATIGLLAWWSGLPDSLSLSPQPPASGMIANLGVRSAGFLRLTALALLPVVVLAGPRLILRRARARAPRATIALGGTVLAWLAATYARVPDIPFVGNYVDRFGVLSEDVLIGNRVLVMPAPLFDGLALIATVAAVLVILAAVPALVSAAERLRARRFTMTDPITIMFVLTLVGFAAAYAVAVITDLPIFDRYALPAIPVVGLLLLRSTTRPEPAPVSGAIDRSHDAPSPAGARARVPAALGPAFALVLIASFGLVLSTDSASFDATRWRVASLATNRGYTPLQINGGFEWVAYHRRRGPRLGQTPAQATRLHQIWLRGLCVDVIVNPPPHLAKNAIVRSEMHGLGHGPVLIAAVPNRRPCHR